MRPEQQWTGECLERKGHWGWGGDGPEGAREGWGRWKVEVAGGAGRVVAEKCGTGPPALPKRRESDRTQCSSALSPEAGAAGSRVPRPEQPDHSQACAAVALQPNISQDPSSSFRCYRASHDPDRRSSGLELRNPEMMPNHSVFGGDDKEQSYRTLKVGSRGFTRGTAGRREPCLHLRKYLCSHGARG